MLSHIMGCVFYFLACSCLPLRLGMMQTIVRGGDVFPSPFRRMIVYTWDSRSLTQPRVSIEY